jgi:hypothetical protein
MSKTTKPKAAPVDFTKLSAAGKLILIRDILQKASKTDSLARKATLTNQALEIAETVGYEVYRAAWMEFERGWGSRPDGYSYHLKIEDFQSFVKEYTKDRDTSNVPDDYDSPCGLPKPTWVSADVYSKFLCSGI